MIAQMDGIISKYFGNLFPVTIKKPKVKIVDGQGKPGAIVLLNEPSTK
jgi:hypothetical protein